MGSRGTTDSDLRARLRAAVGESVAAKRATLDLCESNIVRAAQVLIEAFRRGSKLLAFGNGGSASDAQHFAAELAGRYRRERPGLPALALCANTSDVTALGNDYGFERVFARLIEAHGRAGDVAVAISTSGNSANVLAAVETARERDLLVIGLTGGSGGKLAGMVDIPIVVPSDVTARIQETHITVLHVLCELVDEVLYPEAAGA